MASAASSNQHLKRKRKDAEDDETGPSRPGTLVMPSAPRQQHSDVPLSDKDKQRGTTIDVLVEDKDADLPKDGSARPFVWAMGVVTKVDTVTGELTVHVAKHGPL